mgnify:CR=1 FL=1
MIKTNENGTYNLVKILATKLVESIVGKIVKVFKSGKMSAPMCGFLVKMKMKMKRRGLFSMPHFDI